MSKSLPVFMSNNTQQPSTWRHGSSFWYRCLSDSPMVASAVSSGASSSPPSATPRSSQVWQRCPPWPRLLEDNITGCPNSHLLNGRGSSLTFPDGCPPSDGSLVPLEALRFWRRRSRLSCRSTSRTLLAPAGNTPCSCGRST